MLREALIALILERGWEALSVQDVCERADIGRSTFYTHFADKEDLLISGFADLRAALSFPKSKSKLPLAFAHGLIEHVHENQRLFRALVGKRAGHTVRHQFRQMLLELMREDLILGASSAVPRDAAAHFLSGGMLELLTWWLEGHSSLAPESIEQMFLCMAAAVLQAAKG
jgi:AcrR family transcriptional regulator